MKYTTNYALEKPDPNDVVDIRVINRNMDKMDAEVAKKADKSDLDNINVPVQSVNSKTGDVVLSATDIKTSDGKTLEQFKSETTTQMDNFTQDLNNHIADTVKHITGAERNNWNTKLDASQFTSNNVLAKLKAVDGAGSGLDADTIDGWQFYRDVSELGLTAGTETINSIVEAMPGKSIFITGIGSSHNSSEYPVSYGTLKVFRIDDSRTTLEFDVNSGTPKKWIGNYYMEQKFSGWKEVISQSFSDKGWDNGIVLNSYDGVTEIGRYLDFHNTSSSGDYSVRFDCFSEDGLNIIGVTNECVQINANPVFHTGNRPYVTGEYTGDSVAGRKIVLGFQPYFVWVVPMSNTSSARGGFIFSNGAYTLRGDTYVNMYYADSGVTTTSDGFYVQGAYMNTSGYSYKYFAFK